MLKRWCRGAEMETRGAATAGGKNKPVPLVLQHDDDMAATSNELPPFFPDI